MTEPKIPLIISGIATALLIGVIAISHYVGFDSISDLFLKALC